MWCIAGLGNPGSRYAETPHNLGFAVVDELSRRHYVTLVKDQGNTLAGAGSFDTQRVLLVQPQTFMNLSGTGIGTLLRYRNLTNLDLIVVYDELDLPWTALRIKKDGSAAGHNGIKSIIAALGTAEFLRVRVGIRPHDGYKDAAEYVLAPFRGRMKEEMADVVSRSADAIEAIVAEGAEKAMAKWNRRAGGLLEEER